METLDVGSFSACVSQPDRHEMTQPPNHLVLIDTLTKALAALLNYYVDMGNSGDCGNWDPEEQEIVIRARAALKAAGIE